MARNIRLMKVIKGLWLMALLLYAWGVVPEALAQELEGTAYPMNDLADAERGVTPFASIDVSTVTSSDLEFADFDNCQPPEETTFSLDDVAAGFSVAYWVGVKGVEGQKVKMSFKGPNGQVLKCSFIDLCINNRYSSCIISRVNQRHRCKTIATAESLTVCSQIQQVSLQADPTLRQLYLIIHDLHDSKYIQLD